jgi:hypothetical protein
MKMENFSPGNRVRTAVWFLLPLFTACGGGGGGTPPPIDTTPPPPVIEMGVFIDSPVEGLTYQSGSNPEGTTDANGMFDYTVGETLSFSVGGVQLGTLPDGQPVVTPYDFGAAAENIARLLQTLDADANHLNGIDLTAASTALSDTTLDASAFVSDATTFETTIQPVLDTALGVGATLIDAATAIANLDAGIDSTFDVEELAGSVLVLDLPSESDTGIVIFEPLADPGDNGATVELLMLSDTIAAGGDGSTTVLDWSVDSNGILSVTDPVDSTVITIEKAGGSFGVISIVVTEGAEQLVGSFLIPANGVAMDLSGDDGRSFDAVDASGTTLVTFFPDLFLSMVSDDLVFIEDWSLDASGSLLTITGDNDELTLSVILNGSFVTGGDIITFEVTNLSGDPDAPFYQLDAMVTGTLTPVEFPDPSTAVSFEFTTSATASSPTDPALAALFAGMTVSGSFSYANWVPPFNVSPGPTAPGGVLYLDAMLNLAGSVNGMEFTDPIGFAFVANDRFELLISPPDVFELVDFISIGSGLSLDNSGFPDVAGYTLTGVSWFWIEKGTTQEDFLQSDLLPDSLPLVTGRLRLDFELTADPQVTAFVFFQDLVITPSP